MVHHCHSVFFNRRRGLGVEVTVGVYSMPRLKPTSVLLWRPSIRHVCVYPIDEGGACNVGLQRYLYYDELDARRFLDLKRRVRRTGRVVNEE